MMVNGNSFFSFSPAMLATGLMHDEESLSARGPFTRNETPDFFQGLSVQLLCSNHSLCYPFGEKCSKVNGF